MRGMSNANLQTGGEKRPGSLDADQQSFAAQGYYHPLNQVVVDADSHGWLV